VKSVSFVICIHLHWRLIKQTTLAKEDPAVCNGDKQQGGENPKNFFLLVISQKKKCIQMHPWLQIKPSWKLNFIQLWKNIRSNPFEKLQYIERKSLDIYIRILKYIPLLFLLFFKQVINCTSIKGDLQFIIITNKKIIWLF